MRNVMIVLAVVQVVFATSIHCASCGKKVQENISFEKGVKDLKVDVETKKVTVTFNSAKTDTVKLKKALNKLGYSAEIVDYKIIK
ncbi:MAG: heavy-metal-associated domain-containing protein [Bacteroidales bacterium]|nr:heavy-metal-associated domain-containing protein [Bacteroidales bacterium]